MIEDYLQSGSDHRSAQAEFPVEPSKPCQFLSAEVLRGDGSPGSDFTCEEPFIVRLRFEIREPVAGLKLWFTLLNLEGIRVFCSDIRDGDPSITERLRVGLHTFEIAVPGQLLAPMTYLMNIGCTGAVGEVRDFQQSCCEFTLRDLASQRPDRPGFLSVLLPWEHRQLQPAGSAPDRPSRPAAIEGPRRRCPRLSLEEAEPSGPPGGEHGSIGARAPRGRRSPPGRSGPRPDHAPARPLFAHDTSATGPPGGADDEAFGRLERGSGPGGPEPRRTSAE